MHIGLSLVDLALGGTQNYMVQLAQGLARRGHIIMPFVYARRTDTTHYSPTLGGALDSVAQPAQHPRDLLTCDIIQLDGYHSLRRKLPYLFALGRCVETFHSTYSVRRSGPLYAKHRVVVSRSVQSVLHLPSHLIYQGVPLPTLDQHTPKQFDIAILGRIHPVKQHLLFLQTCERLYRQRGSLSVLLISSHPSPSPYQQQVDAEIARLKSIGLHIHLTGELPSAQVFQWLEKAKVLLVTSETEGYGRMAIEALACEVPVIANPVGGLLEILDDGQTGFFARRDDAVSFAELANRLLDDDALRNEMGHRGRSLVESRFSYEAMLDAYEALYREVAK